MSDTNKQPQKQPEKQPEKSIYQVEREYSYVIKYQVEATSEDQARELAYEAWDNGDCDHCIEEERFEEEFEGSHVYEAKRDSSQHFVRIDPKS